MVEVWAQPAHCGNAALAFLGIADRFQDHCAPPPRPSSFVCSGWHVWLFIIRGKGVAAAINMWLHRILFSTDKAASLTDMRSSLKNLLLSELGWIKGGSEAVISLWQRSADKYFCWSSSCFFFFSFFFFLSLNLFWHVVVTKGFLTPGRFMRLNRTTWKKQLCSFCLSPNTKLRGYSCNGIH